MADPYPVESERDLRDAVAQGAEIVASDAGAELLASPDQEERDALRDRVIADALVSLSTRGVYRDPLGIRWTLG